MIYEDETTVDEAVDYILSGEPVREGETPSAGGAQAEKRMYLNRCKDCGHTFETPYVGGKYCPACKKKRISAGQKARQKREHAADPQENVARRVEPEGAGDVENSSETVQEAWDRLDEATAGSSKPEPQQDAPPRRAQDVILDLYITVRNVASVAGLDPSRTIQALWEMDNIMGSV